MGFDRIKDEVKKIPFETLRTDCDNYFEAVLIKGEISALNERLKTFFGEPAWPSKNRMNFRMQELIKGFGGIMPGQTLYFKDDRDESIFAMLWPWQDGLRTTVKIVKS